MNVRKLIVENQISVILLAFLLGLAFPSVFQPINQWSTQLLILVFFFSSLRLSLSEIVEYAHDWRMLFITSIYMLVILPFALYLPVRLFDPSWSIALLIMGAMPTGMTIALMAEFFGGKTSLALVITTVTSLLAPFTIPIVTKIAVGQAVPIPALQMFWSLLLTIAAPFVFAMLVKRATPKFVAKHDQHWRNISVAAFGLLIVGIVANTQTGTPITITLRDVVFLIASTVLLGTFTWAAYFITPWRKPAERITIALCMLYLNNTLALFVADKFFKAQGVVPKQVLLLVVVNALLPFIKIAAAKIAHPGRKFTLQALLS